MPSPDLRPGTVHFNPEPQNKGKPLGVFAPRVVVTGSDFDLGKPTLAAAWRVDWREEAELEESRKEVTEPGAG